jgi:hypothetical protein
MTLDRLAEIGRLFDLAETGEFFGSVSRDFGYLGLSEEATTQLRLALIGTAWPTLQPRACVDAARPRLAEFVPDLVAHPSEEERAASRVRGFARLAEEGREPSLHKNQPRLYSP